MIEIGPNLLSAVQVFGHVLIVLGAAWLLRGVVQKLVPEPKWASNLLTAFVLVGFFMLVGVI